MPLSDDFTREIENQSQQVFGNLDDIANRCAVDRLGATEGGNASTNPSDTAKQNYTAIRYGNDHGSISFGHIHEKADVTAAVILQTPDGRHQLSMDKDGPRKGWTSLTAPGNIQIEAGSDNQEAQDTLMINSKNGNRYIPTIEIDFIRGAKTVCCTFKASLTKSWNFNIQLSIRLEIALLIAVITRLVGCNNHWILTIFNIQKFKESYRHCSEEVILNWIKDKYKI